MSNGVSKLCTKCKNDIFLDGFKKDSLSKDGLRNWCISCQKEYDRNNYLKKRDLKIVQSREYYNNNKDYCIEQRKSYYKNNKEQIRSLNNEWAKNNPDKIKSIKKRWSDKNKDYSANYQRERRKDPIFRLIDSTRHRIWIVLKENNIDKYDNTFDLIGCTIKELRIYLESLFQEGMTWENYGKGGWHVDHIKPCAAFDLTDSIQQNICFHYTNLQPLWAIDNLSKNSIYEGKRYRVNDK